MDDDWYEKNQKRKAMVGDMPAPVSTYKEKLAREISQISREDKQKILDLMHEGNNIGQVCKIMDLETIIVAHIVQDNFKTYGSYLSKEVVE